MPSHPIAPLVGFWWTPQQAAAFWFLEGAKVMAVMLGQLPRPAPEPAPQTIRPRNFNTIATGDFGEVAMVITREDTERFAELSLDKNPVHLDDEYMATSPYGGTIPHGLRMASLISAALVQCVGPGIIYESQAIRFTRPAHHGIEATARAEVAGKEAKPNEKGEVRYRVFLQTQVLQDGKVIVDGEASVLLPAPVVIH